MNHDDDDAKYRLTVTLADGRTIEGQYDYLGAHARVDAMQKLQDYRGHRIERVASNRDWTAVLGWVIVVLSAAYLLAQAGRYWLNP